MEKKNNKVSSIKKTNNNKSVGKNKNNPISKNNPKRNYTLFYFIGMLLLSILIISYLLSNRSGSIVGKIYPGNDETVLLSNVKITIDNKETIINNTTGTYVVQGLKPGLHKLNFQRDGYGSLNKEVEVKPGKSLKLDIKLYNESTNLGEASIALLENNNLVFYNDNFTNQIKKILVDSSSQDILYQNEKIYVLNSSSNSITVVNSENFESHNIKLKENINPSKFGIDQSGGIFVFSKTLGGFFKFNVNNETLDDNLKRPDGRSANNILISKSDNSVIFVYNSGFIKADNDGNTLSKFENIFVSDKKYSQSNNSIFVYFNGSVSKINKSNMFKETSFQVTKPDPQSLYVNPDGTNLYLVYSDSIDILDASSGTILKSLPKKGNIEKIIFSEMDGQVYLLSNKLYVIDSNSLEYEEGKTIGNVDNPKDLIFF